MERNSICNSFIQQLKEPLKRCDGFALATVIILSGVVIILLSIGLYVYNFSVKSIVLGESRNMDAVISKSTYNAVVQKITDDHYLYQSNKEYQEKNKCFFLKVIYPTNQWDKTDGWTINDCPNKQNATSSNINGVISYPDITFKIGSSTIYAKIVSSSEGNTGISKEHQLNVSGTSTAITGTQSVKPPPLPYVYKIVEVIKDKYGDVLRFTGVYLY